MHKRRVYVAAIVDCVIVATCLVVLCVAEAQRCCTPSGNQSSDRRWLEEENSPVAEPELIPEPHPCSCPTFGYRLYGGLGTIEPFTSLIALRVFRHWFAKKLVLYMEKWLESTSDKSAFMAKSTIRPDPFATYGSMKGAPHKEPESMEDECGTMVELVCWRCFALCLCCSEVSPILRL